MSSYDSTRNAWATGLVVFAATVMITIGAIQMLQAIVALVNDEFYVVGLRYAYEFDLTTWGWVHLVIGAILVLVGGFLFTGSVWARWAGIAVAALCMVANFMWLPYYPLWAIVVIGLNVAVVWALAVLETPGEYQGDRAG